MAVERSARLDCAVDVVAAFVFDGKVEAVFSQVLMYVGWVANIIAGRQRQRVQVA
jgi:hypothetical protein